MKKILLIILALAMFLTCNSMQGSSDFWFGTMNKFIMKNTAAEIPADIRFQAPVLTGVQNVPGGIELSWSQSFGAEKYRVLRKTDDDDWENLGDTEELTFIDEMADPDMVYIYSVRCVNIEGTVYTSDFDETGLRILVI